MKEVQCINILLLLHNSGSQRFSPFILKTLGFQLLHLLRLLLLFWLHYAARRISVLWPRIEPRPWQWKHQILTIRQPGNLRYLFLYMVWDVEWGFLFLFFFLQKDVQLFQVHFWKDYPFSGWKLIGCMYEHLFLECFIGCVYLTILGLPSWLRW